MRILDLDAMRPQLGEFKLTVNGKLKTFKVMKPTTKQMRIHNEEYEKALKDCQKLTNKDGTFKQPDYSKRTIEWYHREIQIFIPEFAMEDLDFLVGEQRTAILDLIFEIKDESSEPKPKKKGKK